MIPTRFWTLGSGSQRNATLIEHGENRLLVDAGFDLADLVARLREAGVAPATVDDVIVTHGHRDHVLGAAHGHSIYGWRIWGTLGSVWQWRALRHADVVPFSPGDTFAVSSFMVSTAGTSHDVDDSSAVVVQSAGGARIGMCTDLGEVTPTIIELLHDLDALVIEANYDLELLETGPYSQRLKARVRSATGHLSNDDAAEVIRAVSTPRLKHVLLAHVSRHSNTPARAREYVIARLQGSAFCGDLHVAPQEVILGPFDV